MTDKIIAQFLTTNMGILPLIKLIREENNLLSLSAARQEVIRVSHSVWARVEDIPLEHGNLIAWREQENTIQVDIILKDWFGNDVRQFVSVEKGDCIIQTLRNVFARANDEANLDGIARSLSAGDIILLDGETYRVDPFGWSRLTWVKL